jgi:hypothetical protein
MSAREGAGSAFCRFDDAGFAVRNGPALGGPAAWLLGVAARPLGLTGGAGWGRRRLANIYAAANISGIHPYERRKCQKVEHQPATTYIVSVFEKPHWRIVLTT